MLRGHGSSSSGHALGALQQTPSADSDRKFRILVVDDSAASRKLTMWMLRELGYVADAVGNGREALEAIERVTFDLVLMDCRMPEMDGYEATRQIRRREGLRPRAKIIAMTAHALSGDEQKRFDAGMDEYISKPITIEHLAAVLIRALDGQRAIPAEASAPSAQTDGARAECGQEPVLDAVMMASLRAQHGLLDGLIGTVLKEVPQQLQQLSASLARADAENAAIAAHSLKSIAAIFGARRMQNSAANVEQAADAGAIENARSEFEQLRTKCERVLHELKTERERGAV